MKAAPKGENVDALGNALSYALFYQKIAAFAL